MKNFKNIVTFLHNKNMLDLSIKHGDGTSTPVKKGGDIVGYSEHKHFKGKKIIAIVDRDVNVITPYVTTAGNTNENPLLKPAIAGPYFSI